MSEIKYQHSLDEVLKALDEVVTEKGEDYEYERVGDSCVYADADGNPSCIVGHVIHKLDPDAFDRVAKAEQYWGSASVIQLVSDEYLPIGFWDANTVSALQEAQAAQDTGSPWGSAQALAETRARDFGWRG